MKIFVFDLRGPRLKPNDAKLKPPGKLPFSDLSADNVLKASHQSVISDKGHRCHGGSTERFKLTVNSL